MCTRRCACPRLNPSRRVSATTVKDIVDHVIHPHRAHQREEEATVVQHERKGARTLREDGEEVVEQFEPLVMYDLEKEKAQPPTKEEIERREEATFTNELLHDAPELVDMTTEPKRSQ